MNHLNDRRMKPLEPASKGERISMKDMFRIALILPIVVVLFICRCVSSLIEGRFESR